MKSIMARPEFDRRAKKIKGPRARTLSTAVLLSGLALGLAACAAPRQAEQPEEAGEYVWPLPPEQPRIKYVRSIRTPADIGAKKSLSVADVLLGEPDQLLDELEAPYGVHVDKEGRIFVADTGMHKVAVLDIPNKKFEIWGTGGKGTLTQPAGISSDGQGKIYVTDSQEQRVVVYDRDGRFVTAMGGKDELMRPVGVAVNDALGRVYVADAQGHRIVVYGTDGRQLFTFGGNGSEPGQFNQPSHIAMDRQGKLYITDGFNFRVQIFDPDGNFLDTFGSIGDGIGQFARPKGVAVDSDGNIYVVDAAFSNFQIFNQAGELLLFVGSGGPNPGQFWLPAGAYIDDQDRIYIADQYNYRIQIFEYLGDRGTAARATGDMLGDPATSAAGAE